MSRSITNLSNYALKALFVLVILLSALKPALIAHVVALLGFLLIFMWRDEQGKFAAYQPVTAVLLGLAIVWAAASLQWTLLPVRGMYDLILLILFSFVILQFPGALKNMDAKSVDQLIKIFMALSVFALLIYVTDMNINFIWQRTISHRGWHEEIMMAILSRSGFCLLLLLWPLIFVLLTRRWNFPALAVWLVMGVSLLASDSAAGRLAYIISTLVFAIAWFRPHLMRLAMLSALLASFVLVLPAAKVSQDLLGHSGRKISGSFLQRTEIWRFTAARIAEKPLTGWGYSSSRAIPNKGEVSKYQLSKTLQPNPLKSIIPVHPHNWLLQIMLELGLPGIGIFLVICVWFLLQTQQLQKRVQAPALAIYAIAMVIGAFSISIWSYWWLAALIFAGMLVQLLDHEAHRTRQ